jgi:hypothetical protein
MFLPRTVCAGSLEHNANFSMLPLKGGSMNWSVAFPEEYRPALCLYDRQNSPFLLYVAAFQLIALTALIVFL